MASPQCFKEKLKKASEEANSDDEIDIYELMIVSIKIGIPLSEWKNLTFATLSNLITTASEFNKKTRERSSNANQQDIDMFLAE